MIFDTIRHVEMYNPPSKVLSDGIDFILNNKIPYNNPQRYEIGVKGMYVMPQEYTLKKKEDKSIEAHHHYIDIQVMMEGSEYLGYADKKTLRSLGYDEDHDFERLSGDLTFLPFRKGDFAVFFPQDAHMPGVEGPGSTTTVKKMVIKVPVGLWQ
ncbi:MAG TPA: YhcH/YjgK/YiaL family protein [Candidatus Thermoplasmatota archaeon]|nr:YhcH/YjgK/YiaL family protein [Candidatus Thermoplasmatota archaeon]